MKDIKYRTFLLGRSNVTTMKFHNWSYDHVQLKSDQKLIHMIAKGGPPLILKNPVKRNLFFSYVLINFHVYGTKNLSPLVQKILGDNIGP